jgi:hypothetical protein
MFLEQLRHKAQQKAQQEKEAQQKRDAEHIAWNEAHQKAKQEWDAQQKARQEKKAQQERDVERIAWHEAQQKAKEEKARKLQEEWEAKQVELQNENLRRALAEVEARKARKARIADAVANPVDAFALLMASGGCSPRNPMRHLAIRRWGRK